eukprot:6491836-Amphidinium_carterae.1
MTLEKKTERQLWAFFLESHATDFEQVILSVCSGTFDMGVEINIPNALATDATHLLPLFLRSDGFEPDRPGEETLAAPSKTVPFVFKNSVVVPGMLHILDNSEAHFHEQMSHWRTFRVQLKAVLKIFASPHVHKRFMSTCVHSTKFAFLAGRLTVRIPMYSEHRWGTLVKALQKLVDIEHPLVQVWSGHAFVARAAPAGDGSDEDDADEALDLGTVTAAIQSPLFWTFCRMTLALQNVLESFRAWSESCPCHRHVWSQLESESDHAKERYLRKEFMISSQICERLSRVTCPCAGRNAPWLALGHYRTILRQVADASFSQLHVECVEGLSYSDRSMLLQNWTE